VLDPSIQRRIEDLHARYSHALDDDRLEEWPELFTEHGVYRIATAENEARGLPLPVLSCGSRAMMHDRIQSLRHANIYEPQRYRHIVSSILLEKIDDKRIRSVSGFLVIRIMHDGGSTLFASGKYLDRILLAPEPKYEERVVVCDSRRFDTLLAIPL
jgi:anthranilate 1,2-dioxygenase small subunit